MNRKNPTDQDEVFPRTLNRTQTFKDLDKKAGDKQIISELIGKLDKTEFIEDCFNIIKDNENWKHTWYTSMYDCNIIWKHPKIVEYNQQKNVLNNWFCTIYKGEGKYVFVYGRMGNTITYVWGA